MNTIIFSALWGVLMMYIGFIVKKQKLATAFAVLGLIVLLIVSWFEYAGVSIFTIDMHGMLRYNRLSLVFNLVMIFSTLVYFLLSGSDIEKFGKSSSDYYALLFFYTNWNIDHCWFSITIDVVYRHRDHINPTLYSCRQRKK